MHSTREIHTKCQYLFCGLKKTTIFRGRFATTVFIRNSSRITYYMCKLYTSLKLFTVPFVLRFQPVCIFISIPCPCDHTVYDSPCCRMVYIWIMHSPTQWLLHYILYLQTSPVRIPLHCVSVLIVQIVT